MAVGFVKYLAILKNQKIVTIGNPDVAQMNGGHADAALAY